MTVLAIDGLSFTFPSSWELGKPDDWTFYRNQFSRMRNGIKATDAIAIDDGGIAWLIEAKDYRLQARTKPSCLAEEVAAKVFDTLAMLLPASVHACQQTEKSLARKACRANGLRVVLHLEQPQKHSRLRPRAIDPAALRMKLKKLIKSIDPHPLIVEHTCMGNLAWTVA